jgi:hypothetical protein
LTQATIQRESQESLLVTVVADVDPTSYDVEFCAVALGERPDTWVEAAWYPPVVQRRDGKFEVRVKTPRLGEDGEVALETGAYETYVRITSGPEIFVLESGSLSVE